MEEVMPHEMVKNNFKASIIELIPTGKFQHVSIFDAITSFGRMTLIVQQFLFSSQQLKDHNKKCILERIQLRNKLIISQSIVTPLIYQQQTIKIRDDLYYCRTLSEPLVICSSDNVAELKAQSLLQNLVKCAYHISMLELDYELNSYHLQKLMKSTYNSNFFLNFTQIDLIQQHKHSKSFQIFKTALIKTLQSCRSDKIQQIIFVGQSPVVFDLQKLSCCQSIFDLSLSLNILQSQQVTVISQTRSKSQLIKKLNGTINFSYKQNQYMGYSFRDGYRTDVLRQLTVEQLRDKYFESNVFYYMTKQKYMCVRKKPLQFQEEWIVRKVDFDDIIYVKTEVNKVEFINFLIAYIKYVNPLLHQINFYAEENILQLVFTNQLGKKRKVVIKFNQKYIVKDEQLSMIIQKSRLKKATLNLQKMLFGDSFLIFLANCDKMLNVTTFDISYCSKVTQSGMNILISSPFFKNVKVLKINSNPIPDFYNLKNSDQIVQISLNDCLPINEGEQAEIFLGKLQRLSAIGLNMELKFAQTIKYLYLTQDFALQHLKLLKNLELIELKVKLVESKKTISTFLNTINVLYAKDNPIKLFSQGACKKTLKMLDISHSSVKLKDIRPILSLQNLQTLICESMDKEKFQDIVLPNQINSLSFKGSKITAENLADMTAKTNFFIKLKIIDTDISDRTLQNAIKNKKYINLLEISEEQISIGYFRRKSCVQGLIIHLNKLLREQNEPLLNQILYYHLNNCKQINLCCSQKHESRLISKVHRFLNIYQQYLKKNVSEITININQTPLIKLINLRNKQNNNEYFTVFNPKLNPHKIKLNFQTLLAQQYGLPLLDEFINIDLFNVTLHKAIQLYPDSLLQICIRNNRLLDKNVIEMIHHYANSKLMAIDFRNCSFSYSDVQQYLYLFPQLISVNEGEYQIKILEEDKCEEELQKILKFFMKLDKGQKMKIKLIANQISDRELYFSIIEEIINFNSSRIVQLQIQFINIPVESHSVHFWGQVFQLQKLLTLKIHYYNYFHLAQCDEIAIASQFQKMVNLSLYCLEIQTSIHLIIPQHLSFKDLHRLKINYGQMDINENIPAKLLKSVSSVRYLTLNMPCCSHLTSLSKISDTLQRMQNLNHLNLNFQNCPIKQAHLLELIQNLTRNTLLEKLQLNINNCPIGLNQIVNACETLTSRLKYCHITLYALQQKKPLFLREKSELLVLGIQLIFNI